MGRAGVFDDGPRGELIDGILVEMSPPGWAHMGAWLTRAVVRQLDDDLVVSPQQSVHLAALRSAPEPDIAVVPAASGIDVTAPLLVNEVADRSLGYDRLTKARLYARHGVGECWIVDVREEQVEVHRETAGDTWTTRTVLGEEAVLTSASVSGVSIALESVRVHPSERGQRP